jgi:DNA repair protein RecO (recombination protein O)
MATERQDTAILLEKHFYGENRCHGVFLLQKHGRLRVSLSRKKSLALQPGDSGWLRWTVRSPEKLTFGDYEGNTSPVAVVFHNPCALVAIKSACLLCANTLPEHTPAEAMFHALACLLQKMSTFHPACYVRFECAALSHFGYGLSLDRCAVTGAVSELLYVSPKTGCAVSEQGAGQYRHRLLKLPAFLVDSTIKSEGVSLEEVRQGLQLTEHFWNRALKAQHSFFSLPRERSLFLQYL